MRSRHDGFWGWLADAASLVLLLGALGFVFFVMLSRVHS